MPGQEKNAEDFFYVLAIYIFLSKDISL